MLCVTDETIFINLHILSLIRHASFRYKFSQCLSRIFRLQRPMKNNSMLLTWCSRKQSWSILNYGQLVLNFIWTLIESVVKPIKNVILRVGGKITLLVYKSCSYMLKNTSTYLEDCGLISEMYIPLRTLQYSVIHLQTLILELGHPKSTFVSGAFVNPTF